MLLLPTAQHTTGVGLGHAYVIRGGTNRPEVGNGHEDTQGHNIYARTHIIEDK